VTAGQPIGSDPPRGSLYVVSAETRQLEIRIRHLLAGDDRRDVRRPAHFNPVGRTSTEFTIAVVNEQRATWFHVQTVGALNSIVGAAMSTLNRVILVRDCLALKLFHSTH
jgi:hypothetical protein